MNKATLLIIIYNIQMIYELEFEEALSMVISNKDYFNLLIKFLGIINFSYSIYRGLKNEQKNERQKNPSKM